MWSQEGLPALLASQTRALHGTQKVTGTKTPDKTGVDANDHLSYYPLTLPSGGSALCIVHPTLDQTAPSWSRSSRPAASGRNGMGSRPTVEAGWRGSKNCRNRANLEWSAVDAPLVCLERAVRRKGQQKMQKMQKFKKRRDINDLVGIDQPAKN
jgi:hypothetical protein